MIGNLFDSPWKILIVAVVLIVLFGSAKLPVAARSLGKSMRILKTEIKDLNGADSAPGEQAAQAEALPLRQPQAEVHPLRQPQAEAHPLQHPAGLDDDVTAAQRDHGLTSPGAVTALSPAAGAQAPGSTTLREVRARGRLRGAAGLLGPAFVAAVAYVDPGNFATNFAGGAVSGYQLLWVILLANLMAMLIQYLTSKVGLATGRSLPELCRERYGRRVNIALWIQAEVIAMATDLAEFVGAAIGLNLIFGVPLFAAGLITAAVAFAILALQQRGYRRFELAVIALLALVGLGFAYLFLAAGGQHWHQAADGLVPHLGGGTLPLAVGIIGATVMPHVVYLHSALQKNRVVTAGKEERRTLLTWNRRDCVIGLGIAGLINMAMLCVAAALFHRPGLTGISALGPVYAHLGSMVGGGAALAFGIALMASGLSSSSVGTYAGQVVMAGFVDWHLPLLARRALTMLPSLLVLALAVNTSEALIDSQIVLSFGIPFAVVPLLLITRDRAVMTDMPNRRLTTALMTATTVAIVGINLYLLSGAVTGALSL